MDNTVLLVLASFPDMESARHIGTELVAKQCAACVNLLPGAASIYRWQGKVCEAREVVALIKTTRAGYPLLQETLVSLHSYACPELIAIEVADGLPAYLQWVRDNGDGCAGGIPGATGAGEICG